MLASASRGCVPGISRRGSIHHTPAHARGARICAGVQGNSQGTLIGQDSAPSLDFTSSTPSTSQPDDHYQLPGLSGSVLWRAADQAREGLQRVRRLAVRKTVGATRRLQRQYGGVVNGSGDGLLLAAAALVMPTLPGNGVEDLLTNRVFLAGFWAWLAAQVAKIFTKRFKKGVWDLRAMVESGGMPSSHSSLCAAITTSVAIQQGLGSPLFAACLCFSVIVMYDAMGVRRHAGKQAEVLNRVIDELLGKDHPVGEIKLKEVLGHTPRQVFCGGLLGLAVGLFYPMV